MNYKMNITNKQQRRTLDNRTIFYAKKMYGNEAYDIASDLIDFLNDCGYDVNLIDNLPRGFGDTTTNPDGSLSYRVGIKQIAKNRISQFPIHEAISPVVTCRHEVFGHGGQWRNEAYKDTPLFMTLLLNDLACRNSPEYYGLDESGEPTRRYFDQPHEIAAQFVGLKMSEKYLASVYGQKEAEAMLTQYVNIRMGRNGEYVLMPDDVKLTESNDYREPFQMPDEPFHSMEEVYTKFKETFIEKALGKLDYDVPKKSTDFVSKYINKHVFPLSRNSVREQIEGMPGCLQKAYVAATAWLNQIEGYEWIREIPAFQALDFPKKLQEVIHTNIKPPNRNELNLDDLTTEGLNFDRAVKNLDNVNSDKYTL